MGSFGMDWWRVAWVRFVEGLVWLRIQLGPPLRGLGTLLLSSLGFLILGVLPIAIAREWHWWGQLIVLVLFGAIFGIVVYRLAEPVHRSGIIDLLVRDEPFGWAIPFLVAGAAFLFASSIFGLGTFLLADARALTLEDPACGSCTLTPTDTFEYYVWHGLDAIPLLEVTERLKLAQPLTSEGVIAGWLLLAFYATAIVPIVGAFRGYWKRRTETPRVRIRAGPWIARPGDRIRIEWVLGVVPSGFVFDVEWAKATRSWPFRGGFESCLIGTQASGGWFTPDESGTRYFRARWRHPAIGVSGWSLERGIAVRGPLPAAAHLRNRDSAPG
jgi:hypothetical protein